MPNDGFVPMKNILQNSAEPKHDFGDDRALASVKNYFKKPNQTIPGIDIPGTDYQKVKEITSKDPKGYLKKTGFI